MDMVLAVLSVVYAAALCMLLWVARKHKSRYALAKGVCSGLFIVGSIVAYFGGAQQHPLLFALLLGALVLCAFGDVFLGVANLNAHRVSKRPFVAGAASFSLAHVVFCAMYYNITPFMWYDLVFSLVLMLVLLLLERADLVRLKKMRPLGYLYTFLVALMASKAVQALLQGGPGLAGRVLLAAGAVLFLVSDCILLFLYFGTRRYKLARGVNLVSYYLGVWLLALAARWF